MIGMLDTGGEIRERVDLILYLPPVPSHHISYLVTPRFSLDVVISYVSLGGRFTACRSSAWRFNSSDRSVRGEKRYRALGLYCCIIFIRTVTFPNSDFVAVEGPLSAEERQRRHDNNLCLYCGKRRPFSSELPKYFVECVEHLREPSQSEP